jgi:hypothetical protein
VSDQLVSVNNDLSVARRAVEAIVGAYPNGGFGCRLMAPRAGYFDALIIEKMFRHHATASISGWDSINGYAREVSRKPYFSGAPQRVPPSRLLSNGNRRSLNQTQPNVRFGARPMFHNNGFGETGGRRRKAKMSALSKVGMSVFSLLVVRFGGYGSDGCGADVSEVLEPGRRRHGRF